MRLSLGLFLLIATCLVLCFADQELQIISVFKPAGCGTGIISTAGVKLKVHYTGSIDSSSLTGVKGKIFDSSIPRHRPFEFILGVGQVIEGWDRGLLDMCVQEKRTLIIPPSMGYGSGGAGQDIPGGATLKFDVECLQIGDGSATAGSLPGDETQQQQTSKKQDPQSDMGPFIIFAFLLLSILATLGLVLLCLVMRNRFKDRHSQSTTIAPSAAGLSSTGTTPAGEVYSPITLVLHELDEEEIEFTKMLEKRADDEEEVEYAGAAVAMEMREEAAETVAVLRAPEEVSV